MARVVSRWDWSRLEYDYFEAPGDASPGGWKTLSGVGHERRALPLTGGIGVSIEDALPELPRGSRLIGRGPRARGQVVRPERSDAADGVGESGVGVSAPPSEAPVVAGFLLGLGVSLALPLPAALPIFLTGTALGYQMADHRSRQVALSGVRRTFKVRP